MAAQHTHSHRPIKAKRNEWKEKSAGVVNARNGTSTARGLFQLLHAQYELNPHGEASFGNAVEECQGGIRYIYGRYHTASRARDFWKRHHWY
ncbi:hypothetical protein K788_0006245 (plasmid) [Paraburkholderia caribensis MBA4]|uniref:Transglycosylase SLT domain-containing protein n=1 Tax=Paraburkholderia caribensis MBA4 TaxID=1323664 RepID=A0A0P0RLD5_9BURK|nr:hypothetical protein K788_0006245 [Paraburkholderia caribensis MBA4]